MRIRNLARRLAMPGALVALVGILATFQYHWLGQLSTAERERLQESLGRQANDFADAFDAELLWIQVAFQSVGPHPDDPETFGRAYDRWREKAKDPRLVRNVYLVDAARPAPGGPEPPAIRLYDPGARRFVPVAWPAELADVKPHLPSSDGPAAAGWDSSPPHPPAGAPADGVKSTFVLVRNPLVPSVPALVLSVPEPLHLAPDLSRLSPPGLPSSLVVQLDRDAMRSSIFPALADEHLAGHDADGCRMAIVDAADTSRVVFARGLPPGSRLDLRGADAVAPLFSLRAALVPRIASRMERARITGAEAGGAPMPPLPHLQEGASAGATAVAILVERVAKGDVVRLNARTSTAAGWQLVLQHPAGSVDAAVAAARRRNLWISFGILAVLAAGVALVIVNAQRSERLAAQQMDFVATVSHELRTPLAVIRSAAQNLSAGVVSDPAKTRYYGDLIENEGRRLTDMVEQVLDYAGVPSGRKPDAPGPVDIAGLLRDVVAAWTETAAAEGVQVDLDLPASLPGVRADGRALRRAVDNLVANALKHGAEGRWVGVAARAGRARGRVEVQVTVSDRGAGIDPADLAHVFEPFYRGRRAVREQVRGNGLGLSLVRRIVETHDGRVTVTSTPGQGASFRIHLPAAAQDPGEQTEPAPGEARAERSAGTT